ncbi:HNH endonuclease signature motif containing protein, partial [Nitrobacter sp. 62-13]|uniref:HNH endonuclease signature motif containing protein n=1 Tax=Nitrobacter sp. 62-13 TaxID=1895797 RepID=UPI0025DB0065
MALPRSLPPAACVRELLHYDPETGRFTWRSGQKAGRAAGSIGGRYVQIMIGKKNYLAHRLAWLYVHDSPPLEEIDHVNGDPRDNRINNLRLASKS